jgi:hypothetical protein
MSDQEKLKEVQDSASASFAALYPAIRARHFMVGVHEDMYSLILHAEAAIRSVIVAAKLLQEKEQNRVAIMGGVISRTLGKDAK